MKKLLSVSFCIALVCTMLVGVTGCPKDKSGKKELKSTTPDAVKIKAGKEGTATIKYTLGADAKIKSFAVKTDNDKVTAKVSPDKLDKSGDATVTITVAEGAKDATVTVTANGEGSTPVTLDTPVKVTIEK